MLGRLIPIAAVKSESPVPSYPFAQNTRSAASSAFSGSNPSGRPGCRPLFRPPVAVRLLREPPFRAPPLPPALPPLPFFFVSFFISPHPILRYIPFGKKLLDPATPHASFIPTSTEISHYRRSRKWVSSKIK